ncbi:MAG: YHS domain-containing protein [Phycisphaerae bacterium]|nr:YHS domain-containing protein [Phycisphaerae bacterium]
MNNRRLQIAIAAVLAGLLLVGFAGCKGKSETETDPNAAKIEAPAPTTTTAPVTQTTCPIMGNPINKAVFTEYKGQKVYFCCAACIEKFKAEPEKYVKDLPQFKK